MNNVDFTDLKALSSSPSALRPTSIAHSPEPSALSSSLHAPHPTPDTQVINTHINIGTGQDLTIKELANLIKKIVGFKGSLEWDTSKPDSTFRKLLDVSKINQLGWRGKVALEDGIKMIYSKFSS